MSLSETQTLKVNAEIDRLKSEAERLEKEADGNERMYATAYKLAKPPQCVTVSRNTAKEIRKKIKFLESVKNGETSLDNLPRLENKLLQIDSQIRDLSSEKAYIYLKMSRLRYLADLIKQ